MRTNGFVCIGRNGDMYDFITSVFKHDDDFYGCTGSTVRPVTEDEWDWAGDPENVAERYEEVYDEQFNEYGDTDCDECDGCPDRDRGCDSCGIPSLDSWIDDAIRFDGIENLMFDPSYTCDASDAFDTMGIEHECTDCIGCGRMFGNGSGYDEVTNRKAMVACEAYEAGAVSYDYAVKVIFGKST